MANPLSAPRAPSRDLLCGLLAVREGILARERFIEALEAHSGEAAFSLVTWLSKEGNVSPAQLRHLHRLAGEHLAAHRGSLAAGVEALSPLVGMKFSGAEPLVEPDATASLSKASSAISLTNDSRSNSVGDSTIRPLDGTRRFRVVRQHARGGLGEVFVAVDEQLHREVALKEIQPKRADNPESRDRFLREAEITGQLEHPGIVPVYGLGTYDDGRPYYAMRLIEGQSLKAAIAEFHKDRGPRTRLHGALAVRFRQLLSRFLVVCQTIHYAHSRRVIHRDVKPDNIMLGKYGETLVIDWGLAKALETPEAAPPVWADRPVLSRSGSATDTIDGTALGTPQYMSPEQAAGRMDLLGPATDIYSLGATLYALLVGQAPFAKEGEELMLKRVQGGDFEPPRTHWPALPKALEAICLRAMSREPGQRYATAQDLATDIEHWLAGEPVSARRESALDLVSRWARRNRAWVTSGAAALIAISFAALAAFAISTSAFFHAENARVNESKQKQVAQEASSAAKTAAQEAVAQRNVALAETYRAYLSEARALRAAGTPGWRYEAAQRLRRAASIDTPQRDLVDVRSEAIVCLADFDCMPVLRLHGHQQTVWSVSFGADPSLLASQDYAGQTRLWKLTEEREISVATDPQVRLERRHYGDAPLPAVRLSPDGKQLAVGQWRHAIELRDPVDASAKAIFIPGPAPPVYIAYEATGKRLAVAWNNSSVGIYDRASGAEQRRIATSAFSGYLPVAFDPAGKWLATPGPTHAVVVHDLETEGASQTIGRHTDQLRDIAVSRDGRLLATAGSDRVVKLWHVTNGEFGEAAALLGHKARVNSVAFTPDGQLLLSVGDDGTLRIWETRSGGQLRVVPLGINALTSVAIDSAGEHVAVGAEGGSLMILRLTSRRQRQELVAHDYFVTSLAVNEREGSVFSASMDRRIVDWNVAASEPRRIDTLPNNNPVHALALSADGETLAVGMGSFMTLSGTDFSVPLLNAATGKVLRRLRGPAIGVSRLAFAPSGKWVAAGTDRGQVFLWRAADGSEVRRIAMKGAIRLLAFAPDSETLIAGDAAGGLALVAGDEKNSQPAEQQLVAGLQAGVLDPGGKHLTLLMANGSLYRYALRAGKVELETSTQSRDRYSRCLAYSSDGRFLAVGGEEGIEVRDGQTMKPLFRLPFPSAVLTVAFDSTGWRLMNAGRAATIEVWDLAILHPQLAALGLDWRKSTVVTTNRLSAVELQPPPEMRQIVGAPAFASAAPAATTSTLAQVRRLRSQGNHAQAIALARQGLRQPADRRQLWMDLAQLYYLERQYVDTKAASLQHLAVCPDCVSAYDLLCRAQLLTSDLDGAQQTLDKWLLADAQSPAVSSQFALYYALAPPDRFDADKFVLHAHRAASLSNERGSVVLLALAHYRRGNYAQALATAKSYEAPPGDLHLRMALYVQALARHKLNETEEAQAWLTLANISAPLAAITPTDQLLARRIAAEAAGVFGESSVTLGRNDALRFAQAADEERLADYAAAIASYSAVLDNDPTDARALLRRGNLYACQQDWEAAARDLTRGCELSPDPYQLYHTLILLAYLDQAEKHAALWTLMHERFDAHGPHIRNLTAKALVLPVKSSREQRALALELHEKVSTGTYADWSSADRALIEYRAGNYAAMKTRLDSAKTGTNWQNQRYCRGLGLCLEALSQQQQGNSAAAKSALQQADVLVRNELPAAKTGRLPEGYWHDWLVIHMLYREASEVLRKGTTQ